MAGPFVKWAGGKAQLVEYMKFPKTFNAYHESFVGGGAVFFALQPRYAFLSDLNPELINAYQVVKSNVEALIRSLKLMEGNHSEQEFYRLRAQDPIGLEPIRRAARFVYLNKTCYNGLYRVNKSGQFNVPFGRYKNPRICDAEGLRATSSALMHATIKCRDYRDALKLAEPGDFVYLDPPYVPLSPTSNFTEYTHQSFRWGDQLALAEEAARLRDEVGCHVLLSNSFDARVKALYQKLGFHLRLVTSTRLISADSASRGKINEILASSYQ